MLGGLGRVYKRRQTVAVKKRVQTIAEQPHRLVLRRGFDRHRLAWSRYSLDKIVGVVPEKVHPVYGPGVVVRRPVSVCDIPWDDEHFTSSKVRLLAFHYDVAVAINAHHQVILPGTFGSVTVMVGRYREPANIGRIHGAHQRMLPREHQRGTWNDEHILTREALAKLDIADYHALYIPFRFS